MPILKHVTRLSIVLLLFALSACSYRVEESGVIRATPDPADAVPVLDSLAGLGLSGQVLTIPAADGVQLHGLWLPTRDDAPTVLYYGGNLSRVSETAPILARQLQPLGVNLLLVDYRGSGRSPGTPGLVQLESDALAVYDHAVQSLGIAPARLVLHGHSLGSFMAGHVALQREIAGLVLEGSATTTEEWVSTSIPWYAKPFVRTEIVPSMRGKGNLAVVQQQSAPLLVLVGADDDVTRPKLSRRLAAAARAAGHPVELAVVADAHHGNVLAQPQAVAAYRAFLDRLGGAVR